MTPDPDYLIVYGTLRPAFTNPFAHYLRQHSRYVGEGSFPGQLFDAGNYPGAIYQAQGPQRVQGSIYDLSLYKTTVLIYLDDYEGISDQFEQPHEYCRTVIPVDWAGNVVHCWFYQYNWPTDRLKTIPLGDYERYVSNHAE